MRISGSVALVTGASSGIGREVARRLAAAGARVLAHGRDLSALSALDATPLVADLAEPGAGARLAETALGVAGRVDIVVANAGLGWAGPFSEMPPQTCARLLAVNLAAPIDLTRALLPHFGDRPAYLLYVTSIAGRMGVAGEAVYSATKAGLDSFAESLRFELRDRPVGVGVLVPGVVDTAFFERRGRAYDRASPRPIPAGVVADRIVKMIDRSGAEVYMPRWLRVPVAVRGTLPGMYRRLAARFGSESG
ncbi:SDR family NAD(P)-dependent oxidoreductase [Actinoplanes solisilvae]|uniref:SDR family NAD(P)-dependent oxidoreductase n=1 Tax=Actinoplanes solisilvae TaxID=2486853 RepID=UPI000FD98231|nr:SDR family NAD(P)-dependent oxidoreductase [Actinoplanes solisilvae]